MLPILPDEMLNNPKCYKVVRNIGYVPSEEATEHEAEIVNQFNISYKKTKAREIIEV